MKPVIRTAAMLGLLVAGAVQAQTTTTRPSTAPAPSASMPVTPASPAPASSASTTAPAPATSPAPAAVSSSANPRTTAAPVAGANSFTEGQARARIADRGFGNVTDLKKDDQGVWRGTAQKDGKSVSVALDYQGNVQTR